VWLAVFPALSVAVTVKLWVSTVEVSMPDPFAAVPVQEATPEPPASSAQV
jgi:hypothetical protein